VIPFRVEFRAGASYYEQVVYAAKKAIISGKLRQGDAFPSVRNLSRELKINPNTAHKVVSLLVAEGLLEIKPGIGTIISVLPDSTKSERAQLLGREIEELVVEAKRLGLSEGEVFTAISAHWERLMDKSSGKNPERGGRSR
jgi:GntR family transcriptional regulator